MRSRHESSSTGTIHDADSAMVYPLATAVADHAVAANRLRTAVATYADELCARGLAPEEAAIVVTRVIEAAWLPHTGPRAEGSTFARRVVTWCIESYFGTPVAAGPRAAWTPTRSSADNTVEARRS